MWGVPVSDDEAARRKALAVAMWEQKIFPPLYRVSTMDPETLLHGTFGSSSPVMTLFIFAGEDGRLHRPRLEVHTFERGGVEVGAPMLWRMNFGSEIPESSGRSEMVPVTVGGSPLDGVLLAATPGGWMVSVEAADAALLVLGTGELPSPLLLEPVDLPALKRSEFRNSGVVEP
jgi:hypothetical protein